jgi:glycerol-3-phosphate acyltransferase PlsX
MPLTIAIDAMGGDLGPQIVVAALAEPLRSNPNLQLVLFGDQKRLSQLVSNSLDASLAERVEIRHSPTAVNNADKPSTVLRSNRDSSMAMAIKASLMVLRIVASAAVIPVP